MPDVGILTGKVYNKGGKVKTGSPVVSEETDPRARRAKVTVLYNGVNASGQLDEYLSSFRYTDIASGSSDSVSLEINDPDRKWIGPWFPEKGDKLAPTIETINWDKSPQWQGFNCGLFRVDDFSFRGGPIRLSLEAVALPADSDFKSAEVTQTYEQTTLQEIGDIIAGRAGISLVFEAQDVSIEKIEQNKQTDCDFYNTLIKKYGLALKIFNDKLVVFSEADYEGKKPKAKLTEEDFEPGWSWDTQTTGTYTGVSYSYSNTTKNKTFTVTAGEEGRVLTVNDAADSLEEAMIIALAAVNNANKAITTMKITLKARMMDFIASDCVEIQKLGRLSGKYYIEQIEHSIGSGYKMSLSLRKVEPRITGVTSATIGPAEKKKKKGGA